MALQEGGLTRATSVTVVGAAHDISQVADNLLRSILASFVADPSGFHAAGGGWARCCVRRAGGAAPMSPREFLCRDDTDPGVFAFDGPLLSRR